MKKLLIVLIITGMIGFSAIRILALPVEHGTCCPGEGVCVIGQIQVKNAYYIEEGPCGKSSNSNESVNF